MVERVRRWLPSPLFGLIRRIGTAVLTPPSFSYRTGHFRSSLKARAVERGGRPLPWYTYPATEEFGAGQSTFSRAEHARQVTSFESNPKWLAYVSQSVPANVSLHLVHSDIRDTDPHLQGLTADVIVIDDLDRLVCARRSLGLQAPDGAVILDNAEGHWGSVDGHPIMDLFREQGFSRVDFYGCAPGVMRPHCTSVFFRKRCFLFTGAESPARQASF